MGTPRSRKRGVLAEPEGGPDEDHESQVFIGTADSHVQGALANYVSDFRHMVEERVASLRSKEIGLTRDIIARRAGMSRQHLWRGLRGLTRFTSFEVSQLARVLGMNPYDLAGMYLRLGRQTGWSDGELADFATHFQPASPSPEEEARTSAVRERLASVQRVDLVGSLPRDIRIAADEFKIEALRRGADDDEMAFINSVLHSPEAIFRQSGYRGIKVSPETQLQELESVIAMLRTWLEQHIRLREERLRLLVDEEPGQ